MGAQVNERANKQAKIVLNIYIFAATVNSNAKAHTEIDMPERERKEKFISWLLFCFVPRQYACAYLLVNGCYFKSSFIYFFRGSLPTIKLANNIYNGIVLLCFFFFLFSARFALPLSFYPHSLTSTDKIIK